MRHIGVRRQEPKALPRYGYGGEIIKSGGDALLVLFRGDGHGRRCANAALAMQIALHTSPTAMRANLTMTVGASHGPFDLCAT